MMGMSDRLVLKVRFNDKLESALLNDYRITGIKWNDVDNGHYLEITVSKKDILSAISAGEFKETKTALESINLKEENCVLSELVDKKDKEIKELEGWVDWYKMWHKKFQIEIENLKTELETYRPTKLHGNGQCKCFNCNAINWTDWCSSYKGHTYCDNCLKVVLEDERQQQLKPFIKLLNEIKEYATTPIKDDGYSVNLKIPYEIAEYVDNHINALLGKSE